MSSEGGGKNGKRVERTVSTMAPEPKGQGRDERISAGVVGRRARRTSQMEMTS